MFSFVVVVVSFCWMLNAQLLESSQYDALMNIYEGMGSCPHSISQRWHSNTLTTEISVVFFFSLRMQRNHLPAIPIDINLH
jgi:hypothetical protein